MCIYSERPHNALLEIEQRAALPQIHFLWGILRSLRVYIRCLHLQILDHLLIQRHVCEKSTFIKESEILEFSEISLIF